MRPSRPLFPAPIPASERRTVPWLALVLAVLALAVHSRTIGFPPLELGALQGVSELRPTSARAWWSAARDGHIGGLTLLAASALGGGSAVALHLPGLLLHAAASACLFLALARMQLGVAGSALIAGFFVLHPSQVEPVTWPAQLGLLIGSTFLFAALCWYPGPPARRGTGRGLWQAALLLALIADPGLCLAPLLVLLLERWPLRRLAGLLPEERARHRRRLAVAALPILLVGVVLGVLHGSARSASPGILDRILHAPLACSAMLRELVWPSGLAWFHPHPASLPAEHAAASWSLAASWLALAALLGAGWWLRARFPALLLGVSWFLLLSVPHALFPTSETFRASSWSYAALPGIALLFVLGSRELLGRAGRAWMAPALLALAACAALTWTRQADWRSARSLHERALAMTEANYRAHDGLGLALLAEGRLSPAEREYRRALEVRPGDALSLLRLGELEIRRALIPGHESRLHEAEAHLERALALDPELASGWEKLGEAFQRAGDPPRARQALERALELEPSRALASTRLGMVLLELADPLGAERAFARACELRPDFPDAWCGRGIARLQLGDDGTVATSLDRALLLEPDHVEARTNLGHVLEERGELAAAESEYRRAVDVNPDYTEALYSLGNLCQADGRNEEALLLLERTLRLRPTHVRAKVALARLWLERGQLESALEHLLAVTEQNPEHLEANLLLGRIALEGRKLELAREHFSRVLRLAPENVEALEGLSAVHAQSGRREQALELLERALELAPAEDRARLEKWIERLRGGDQTGEAGGLRPLREPRERGN